MVRDSSASPRGSQGYSSNVTAQTPFNNNVFNSTAPQIIRADITQPKDSAQFGRRINHTNKAGGFYLDPPPGKPVDPWDCAHYPASPYCGGLPFSPKNISLGIPEIRIDKCNVCVCTTPSLGFVELPTRCICYKMKGCVDIPPPPKPSIKDPKNQTVSKPPSADNCGGNRCAAFKILSFYFDYTLSEDGTYEQETAIRNLEEIQFPPNYLKPRINVTNSGVQYTEYPIVYIKSTGSIVYETNIKGVSNSSVSINDETWLYESDFIPNGEDGSLNRGFPGSGAEEYGECSLGLYTDPNIQNVLTEITTETGNSNNVTKTVFTSKQLCENSLPYKPNKPPSAPSPPPPKKKCECMPDCGCDCETIRLMIARATKPLATALGTDSSNNVFPISYPESLLADRGDGTLKINSIPEQTTYVLNQLDQLLGQFPVQIEVTDDNKQTHTANVTNISEALGELLLLSVSGHQTEKQLTNISLRTLVESGATKNLVYTVHEMIDCIMHFLNFKTSQTTVDVDSTFNPNVNFNDPNLSLDDLLTETTVQVKTEEYSDGETLKDDLHKLLFSAHIIKSVFWRKLPDDLDSAVSVFKGLVKDTIDFTQSGLTDPTGTKSTTEEALDYLIEQLRTNYANVGGIPDNEKEYPYGRTQDRAPTINKLVTEDPLSPPQQNNTQ